MRLDYLPQPGTSKQTGVGLAFSGLGKTISDLGQLGADENKRVKDEKLSNEKLDLQRASHKRADAKLKLSQDEFEFNKKEVERNIKILEDEKASDKLKEGSSIKLFKMNHPNYTSGNYTRDDYLNLIKEIGIALPKKGKVSKVDVRVTANNHKILIYEQDGIIQEKDLGEVKDYQKSTKSDVPEGYVKVEHGFYNEFADTGKVKDTGHGYIAPIDFVNKKTNEMKKAEAKKAEEQKAVSYAQKQKQLEESKALIFGKNELKDPVLPKKKSQLDSLKLKDYNTQAKSKPTIGNDKYDRRSVKQKQDDMLFGLKLR